MATWYVTCYERQSGRSQCPKLPGLLLWGSSDISPAGALATTVGGLAAARILSLMFMLIATVLLYYTGRHLFGKGPQLSPVPSGQ